MSLRQACGAPLFGAAICLACLYAVHEARADLAAITSQNADALTLFDTESLEIVASLPLPGKPAAVATDAGRDLILAVATDPAALHVFDLSGTARAVWPLPDGAFGVAIRPESGTALVSVITGFVAEIDPESGRELSRWQTGAMPSGLAAEPGLIVVTNRDADSVTLISDGDAREVATGHHPFGVTLYEGRAFVTDVLSDQVSVIDLAGARVIARIPTGERPYAVAFAAGKGFVSNQYEASLTVFDADSLEVLTSIATEDYPEGVAATADESRILVANWFSDTVQVIDSQSLEVIARLEMPAGPRAFGRFVAAKP